MAQYVDLSIIDLLGYYSERVEGFSGSGDERTGRCPLPSHEDTQPSFSVNVVTGLWFCHAEDHGGNIVDFHAELNGISKGEAFKELCRIYNIPLDGGGGDKTKAKRKPAKSAKSKKKPTPPKERKAIDDKEVEKFDPVTDSARANVKEDRGLSDGQIDGMCMDSHFLNKAGKAIRRRKGDETGRIVIWIRDSKERVINGRRYLLPSARGWAEEKHKEDVAAGKNYPLPTAKMLSFAGYGGDASYPDPKTIAKSGEHIFFFEGEMDCLLALSLGINACTRTGKRHEWTQEDRDAFKGKCVTLCFDADQPGERIAEATARNLKGYAKAIDKIQWPDFMGQQNEK